MDRPNAPQLVAISDTHCGCRMGLIPPEGIVLDDGGTYSPSRFQLAMWEIWLEFWNEWVPRVTKGEPWDLLHNGDALDGVHHGSVTQISHNLEDQHKIARACLSEPVARCIASGGRYYHVRGTEAHVGKSAAEEERLASSLGATVNEAGQAARWELWHRIGPGRGALIHAKHHIATTGSSAYESTAVHKAFVAMFMESGRWGDEPPQVLVRSHRHRHFEERIALRDGYGIATVTPGWQGLTPFIHRFTEAPLPQFGGIVIRRGDEELHSRFFVRRIGRPAEG